MAARVAWEPAGGTDSQGRREERIWRPRSRQTERAQNASRAMPRTAYRAQTVFDLAYATNVPNLIGARVPLLWRPT